MESLLQPLHPSVSVIVPLPSPCLVFHPSLIPCHSPHPSVSVALFHPSLFQNVESLLRGETASAEQFLCLRPIACPLIELQLLIKMSESSALWGPEALFNPLRLRLTLALPLHPLSLSPCLTPLIAIDFLHPRFIFLPLRQGRSPGRPRLLLGSSMLQSAQAALDVTCTPRCMLERAGDPVRTVISQLREVQWLPFILNQAYSLVLATQHNKI